MPWWDPQTWDWATLAKTLMGAGFVTALVRGTLAIRRDRRQRKSRAASMSMHLAATFEAYAAACSDFISYNENVQPPPEGEDPHWRLELPELPPYPDDPDGWQAIDRKLAARCLSLRQKIQQSQGIIGSAIEYDMDHLGDTLDEQAAGCGLEACELAAALRYRHVVALWRKLAAALLRKHGAKEINTGCDCAEHLESALRKAVKAKEKRCELRLWNARETAALMAELQISIDEEQSSISDRR